MPDLSTTFLLPGVAAAYRHRPHYPEEIVDVLCGLTVDEPRHVLDLGAGEGALARPLAARLPRVDAVEISAAMVEVGRQRPGGDTPGLVWHVTSAEDMRVTGPFALVTAGASLHWMDRPRVLGRVFPMLTTHGVLAVVEHGYSDLPWASAVRETIVRHSRSRDYDPAYSVAADLTGSRLWEPLGEHVTAPVIVRQSVEEYVEQFHSTSSLARELMPQAEAAAFDEAVRDAVAPYAEGTGMLRLPVVATATWGRPTGTP